MTARRPEDRGRAFGPLDPARRVGVQAPEVHVRHALGIVPDEGQLLSIRGQRQRGLLDRESNSGRRCNARHHPSHGLWGIGGSESARNVADGQPHEERRDQRGAEATAGETRDGLRRGFFRLVERVLDLDPNVRRVVQPMLGVLLQATAQQTPDRRRHVAGQPVPVGLGLEHRRKRVRDGGSAEQPGPGQHFEEHGAQRPEVGALVDRAAARLFGAHVGGGAEDRAGDGAQGRHGRRRLGARPVVRRGAGDDRLGQTEVEHLDLAVRRDLHVGRFEIAVHDAVGVRSLERRRDLTRNGQRFVERHGPACDPFGQVLAGDQLHGEEPQRAGRGFRLVHRVDRGDVRMVQRGE